jgi:hypothetical protein
MPVMLIEHKKPSYIYKSKGKGGVIFLRNWSWELADDYENGFEYWKKYHVGVREILMAEAERLLK